MAETPRTALRRFFDLELLDNRYPALHGLRVLAIISVVQFHVTWIFAGENGIPLDAEWMDDSLRVFFGMDLFFILSGFLIGSILLHSLRTDGTQNLRRFYVRRIARTFPPYYVVLTFLAVVFGVTAMQRRDLVYEYVYLTDFMPLGRLDTVMFWGWSLALEEQFYLLVPFLFFLLARLRDDRTRVVLLVALWLGGLAARFAVYLSRPSWTDLALYEAVYFRPHTRFDTLVAGILLAVVHARWKDDLRRWFTAPFHRALVGLWSLGFLWFLCRPNLFGTGHTQVVHLFLWGTVTSLMYFGVLLWLLHSDGWVHRALSHPVFRRFATLGYGIYLVHIPVCDRVIVPLARILERSHVSLVVVWPVALIALMAASAALAYLLHVLVEKPSLRIRERLAS